MRRMERTARRGIPLRTALALLATGCAVNPATGERQFLLVSQSQEIAMGREADPQVIASYGLYPDTDIQTYVRGIGERLASLTTKPDLPWTFRVVDDPIVNAFALPGGFVYVTRGIMVYFESEAELASVLGHEIGHVTARHSAEQMTQQQIAQVGLAAGTILLPKYADLAGVAGAGLSLMFLKFSRDDEREADDLGLRYMTRGGYDAAEMPGVFAMLQSVSDASGGGGLPNWLSTHPDPTDRQERIERRLDSLPPVANPVVHRNEYLQRIDGMTVGQNPREGFFRGQRFLHPDLRFELEFPAGWQTANQRSAVLAQSAAKDAVIQLTVVEAASPDDAVRAFTSQEGVSAGAPRTDRVNGLPAASAEFSAQTDDGLLRGSVTAIAYGQTVYRFLAFAVDTQWDAYRSTARATVNSFRELTDPDALAVQPLRLSIVQLDRTMTLQEFDRRYPSQVSLDQLALLNRVAPSASLPAGGLAKRVVGGPVPW